jgi:RimJ/RimL family protein N-acetyltransferase
MLELRDATSRDEDFLKSCIREAYHEFPRLLARGEATLEVAAENDYERVDGGFAHIAVLDGHPVGAAWWLPSEEPGVLTVAYFVQPQARGQGVATKMVERGLTEARRRNLRGASIKTHPDNAASIALARKLGFEPLVTLLRQSL